MTKPAGSLTPETLRQLASAVTRSERRTSVQLDVGFVRSRKVGDVPPAASMLRGGRGGEVRLKLYLCVCLVATKPPYDISRSPVPARAWAETLGLPEPDGRGARRVSDALEWLDAHAFVKMTRRPGLPPHLRLLDPMTGGKYVRPRGRWISVPLDLWISGWIVSLSGAATVLLLILLELQGGRDATDPPWLPTGRRPQYGVSDDTWTRATAELRDIGLLSVGRVPQGRDFDFRRMRNTYWVDVARLAVPPGP